MISTTYSSTASVPFTDASLRTLLDGSRRANARRGLTGMLLYRRNRFMQVLEGPEEAVRGVLAKIAADPRHSGVWNLATETIEHRSFPEWTMGYRTITDATFGEMPGSNAFLVADRDDAWTDPSKAKALLEWFRDH